MRTIDDRDIVINQGGNGRNFATPWRLLASFSGIVLLLALVVILFAQVRATFDPIEREARAQALYQQQQLDSQIEGVKVFSAALLTLALPVALSLAALGVVVVGLILVYQRWAAPISVAAHYQAKIVEARYSQALPQHYAPHFAGGTSRAELPELLPIDAPALPGPTLPGVTDLAALNYRPTKDAILLGLGAGGEPITAPIGKLWHIATAGPTGNGKSNIHRLLLAQLLTLGANVCIGDPKWTPYDEAQNEDWRPIEARLHLKPAYTADGIGSLLDYATGELGKRLERRRNQQPIGTPLFLAFDELPWIFDHVKGSNEAITELIRVGRGVNVLVLAAAQDFLVKSTGISARDNFRSTFYTGGDLKTGAVLLDTSQKELSDREHEIVFGTALIRSTTHPEPTLARIPYVSNQALYQLLGEPVATSERHTNGYSVATQPADVTVIDMPQHMPESSQKVAATDAAYMASESVKAPSAEAARVAALFYAGKDPAEIVQEVKGISSRQGARYQQALKEVLELIREAR